MSECGLWIVDDVVWFVYGRCSIVDCGLLVVYRGLVMVDDMLRGVDC